MNNIFERTYFLLTILFLSYLLVNNRVFGVDAYYWLYVSNFKPYVAIAAIFALNIFILKTIRKFGNEMVAALFLGNAFIIRFFEFEMDDFLMYFTGFSIPILIPLIIVGYVIYHIGSTIFFINPNTIFNEDIFFPFNVFVAPGLYLITFFFNEKRKAMIYLLSIFLFGILLPTPKMQSNLLPLFAYFLLTKIGDFRYLESKFLKGISLLLIVAFFISMFILDYRLQEHYQKAEIFCKNFENKCLNEKFRTAGHYLKWKGYNPTFFPY